MVDAIPALTTKKAEELFARFGVFSAAELRARAEIKYEIYAKDSLIEARTMLHMANTQLIPAMISYAGELAECAVSLDKAGADGSTVKERLAKLTGYVRKAQEAQKRLAAVIDEASSRPEGGDMARFCREAVVPAMEELRRPVDMAERITKKAAWPVPTYADLMFEV